jgi:hypothetical protein
MPPSAKLYSGRYTFRGSDPKCPHAISRSVGFILLSIACKPFGIIELFIDIIKVKGSEVHASQISSLSASKNFIKRLLLNHYKIDNLSQQFLFQNGK